MEKSLKDLISRLPIPGLKESQDRKIIADAITSLIGIPVRPRQITFKEGIVTVSVPPIVKSVLHTRERELEAALAAEGVEMLSVR